MFKNLVEALHHSLDGRLDHILGVHLIHIVFLYEFDDVGEKLQPFVGLFVVGGQIPVKAVAYRNLPDAYIPDWMESLKRVEAMDFDILVPGHGALGNKADVSAFRDYLEELHAAVLEQARAGKSLEEMQQSIRLEKYKDWFRYEEFLPLNIEGMYSRISLHRRGN